jgi:hypothetical protein
MVADKACERPHECGYQGSTIARISFRPMFFYTIKQPCRVARAKEFRIWPSHVKSQATTFEGTKISRTRHEAYNTHFTDQDKGRMSVVLEALINLPHSSIMALGMLYGAGRVYMLLDGK